MQQLLSKNFEKSKKILFKTKKIWYNVYDYLNFWGYYGKERYRTCKI